MNPKQRAFVDALLKDDEFNLTNAAREAGYASPAKAGSKLLDNRIVRNYVGKKIREREERLEIEADRTLLELARLAYVNPKDLVDEDGKVIPLKKMPRRLAACVKKLKIKTRETEDDKGRKVIETTAEIEVWDKLHALELLARHQGLFEKGLRDDVPMMTPQVFAFIMNNASEQPDGPTNVVDTKFIDSKLKERTDG